MQEAPDGGHDRPRPRFRDTNTNPDNGEPRFPATSHNHIRESPRLPELQPLPVLAAEQLYIPVPAEKVCNQDCRKICQSHWDFLPTVLVLHTDPFASGKDNLIPF